MPGPLVLHVVDDSVLGGAETQLVTILRESLRTYPYRHMVVFLFGGGPAVELVQSLGVPVAVLDLQHAVARRRYLEAFRAVLAEIRKSGPDIVVASLSFSRLLGLPAAFLAGVPRRIGFEQGDVYLDSWKWRIANFLSQWFAHSIIVCSHALKRRDMRLHGFREAKLEVLHNCVDSKVFGAFEHPKVSREELFGDGRTIFCAVGSLGRGVNKRTDVCIRALTELRGRGLSAGLVVCGEGPLRGELEELAARLGVSSDVRFLGLRLDVDHVLACCDAFCHAAEFEPFGIACLEAMRMGLPVIVPASGGIVEIVSDGVDGLLYPPLDSRALAARMEEICRNPGKAREMGQHGRHKALSEFSVEAYLPRFYALLTRGARPPLSA
jgi:glycosyltransferase involved in cell wall biosynthesis